MSMGKKHSKKKPAKRDDSSLVPAKHANAAGHKVVMAKLRKMTRSELANTVSEAGIATKDGKLAPEYRADA